MESKKLLMISCVLLFISKTFSQENSVVQLPAKYFEKVLQEANDLQEKLEKRSKNVLARMKNTEKRLKKKLSRIDSLAAESIFSQEMMGYEQVEHKVTGGKVLVWYLPRLDSLLTTFDFLKQNNEWLSPDTRIKENLNKALIELKELEGKFTDASIVENFLKARRQFLKNEFERFGFTNNIKKINKEVYYYSEFIKEYREVLKDPEKIAGKVIEVLKQTKAFQDFFRKNSVLARLFPAPYDPNDPGTSFYLAGLQTRANVNTLIQSQISSGGVNAQQQFGRNIAEAQNQLQQLKDKVFQSGGESSKDILPENFKPNHQKTKSFWQRIEVGSNLQSQRSTRFFPITSDIGLSVGYKLNDKSVLGLGTSYKLGWGSGWNNIRITHEGFGIRCFFDWRFKGEFWITGGYEQNHRPGIRNFGQLNAKSSWQTSGLIGISKVITIEHKFFKKTKLQLLWDFLAYTQVPRNQPIVFRIGYNIK